MKKIIIGILSLIIVIVGFFFIKPELFNIKKMSSEKEYRGLHQVNDVIIDYNGQKYKTSTFGNYHALLIYVEDYINLSKLITPKKDVESIAKVLKNRYGFKDIKIVSNPKNSDELIAILDDLKNNLKEEDNLLIYYAGHGSYSKTSQKGFWQLKNAEENRRVGWISLDDAINYPLKEMNAKHILVVSDSCYSGAILRDGVSMSSLNFATKKYYTKLYQLKSRTALTSGSLQPVLDGDSTNSNHSVFANGFLTMLKKNTKPIFALEENYPKVKRYVLLNSKEQKPLYSDVRLTGHEDGGDFIFLDRKVLTEYREIEQNSSIEKSYLSLFVYDKNGKELGSIKDNVIDSKSIAPYVVDEVNRRFSEKTKSLKKGTYKIYTTIDIEQQKLAKVSLLKGYNKRDKNSKINGGMIVVNSKKGEILALVGGIDYEKNTTNHITMEQKKLGTAFYPFIYQMALDMGYNPATELTDVARSFTVYEDGKKIRWRPKNFQKNIVGFIKLKEALIASRNLVTINLVTEFGQMRILEKLNPFKPKNIIKDERLSVGNIYFTPLKVAKIYTMFANSGNVMNISLIDKVVDENNINIYKKKEDNSYDFEFSSPEQIYLMTSILQDLLKRGFGSHIEIDETELAGEIGRMMDNQNQWFCGYSPFTEVIVWFGEENNNSVRKGGAKGELVVTTASYFFKKLYQLYPTLPRKFDRPDGVYNSEKGMYTDISPLPTKEVKVDKDEEYELF